MNFIKLTRTSGRVVFVNASAIVLIEEDARDRDTCVTVNNGCNGSDLYVVESIDAILRQIPEDPAWHLQPS